MMNIYKNDPKYKPKYKKTLCQKISFIIQVGIVKISNDNKNTKLLFLGNSYKVNSKWSKVSL